MLPAVETPRLQCLSDQHAFLSARPRAAWRCRCVVQAASRRSAWVAYRMRAPRHTAHRHAFRLLDISESCSRSEHCGEHPSRRDACTAAGVATLAALVQGWAAVPAAVADGSDALGVDTTITDRVFMDIGAPGFTRRAYALYSVVTLLDIPVYVRLHRSKVAVWQGCVRTC